MNRQPIDLMSIHKSQFSDLTPERFLVCWTLIAELLDIPANRLRPNDRWNAELGHDPLFPHVELNWRLNEYLASLNYRGDCKTLSDLIVWISRVDDPKE